MTFCFKLLGFETFANFLWLSVSVSENLEIKVSVLILDNLVSKKGLHFGLGKLGLRKSLGFGFGNLGLKKKNQNNKKGTRPSKQ